MDQRELERLLLVEAQHEIAAAARLAVAKLGQPVPEEARSSYLTEQDREQLRSMPFDLSHPVVQKSMAASVASGKVLTYPPDGVITDDDAAALESLKLSEAQRSVLERVVAEACHSAFFQFLCLLDAVADPRLTALRHWPGARLVYRRKEGPMLHDELYEAFRTYRIAQQSEGR